MRAVMRRLDPWAALLLGVLLALGVVILLATPGPWQRVVGQETPVKLSPAAPDDIALFVLGGSGGRCSGVVWLHVGTDEHSLTALVVPRRVAGYAPGAGYAPISDIVDAAGPRTAAAALGRLVDVDMDAWVTLDRQALAKAVRSMFSMNDVRAARTRYRRANAAWRGRGGAVRSWLSQYETLREALPQVPFQSLNIVAFSNYVLGFGFVESDLTLQGATSLADALRDVDAGLVEVRAAASVVERCRGGEVWHIDSSRMESLRQSIVFGLTPPESGTRVVRRTREARVLVVAPMPRVRAEQYADEVRRSLARSAGAPVDVTLVSGASERLAYRAACSLDRRPALAVLIAPAPGADAEARKAITNVSAMLKSRQQEAVVAGPLPAGSKAAADSPARALLESAIADTGLPVSWMPDLRADFGGEDDTGASERLVRAARANVQTLVRACWPGALAPDLASTRLGFTFVVARNTDVAVAAATSAKAAATLNRLRLWGYVGQRLAAAGWEGTEAGRTVWYHKGRRSAAVALAGDLGIPARAVVVDDAAPSRLVVSE